VGPDKPPPAIYAPCWYVLRLVILLALLAAVLVAVARPAHAVQLTGDQCKELAIWASDTVWAKHVGADKERVRAYYAEQRSPVFTLLLRDFEKIWGLDLKYRIPLYNAVLEACTFRMGTYPDET